MNRSEFRAKVLWPVYCMAKKITGSPFHLPLTYQTIQETNQVMFEALSADKPVMICRMGATELETVTGYINRDISIIQKLVRKLHFESIGFNARIRRMICDYSGFFPADTQHLTRFCELMLDCMGSADILGCWRPEELRVRKYFKAELITVPLNGLEPFFCENPWTRALEGKKVLVIHPFSESIEKQYRIREKLFGNPLILPKFELRTIQAVQSLGGESSFPSWFDALESMKDEIARYDFDVALIGAGAYGFPLASHVKRMGKMAIHLGGVLQMLFGIYGNRWKNSPLINEYWIPPSKSETPKSASKVENATYWCDTEIKG